MLFRIGTVAAKGYVAVSLVAIHSTLRDFFYKIPVSLWLVSITILIYLFLSLRNEKENESRKTSISVLLLSTLFFCSFIQLRDSFKSEFRFEKIEQVIVFFQNMRINLHENSLKLSYLEKISRPILQPKINDLQKIKKFNFSFNGRLVENVQTRFNEILQNKAVNANDTDEVNELTATLLDSDNLPSNASQGSRLEAKFLSMKDWKIEWGDCVSIFSFHGENFLHNNLKNNDFFIYSQQDLLYSSYILDGNLNYYFELNILTQVNKNLCLVDHQTGDFLRISIKHE